MPVASPLQRVAGTNPAANTEITETVPAGKAWRLQAVTVRLVQGITQTPQPILVLDDGLTGTSKGTVTVTIATPAVFSFVGHGLVLGGMVSLTTTGALPTGLAVGTTYFVIAAGLTADAFQVAATDGGAAINTSGTQSGVHTLYQTSVVYSSFGSSAAQAVSTTCRYTWAPDLVLSGQVGATTNVHSNAPLPDGLLLPAGYRVRTSTLGIGANSDYGAPSLLVVEYA